MKYFKDEQNQVFAYTAEQLALVAALNKLELIPVTPNYEHDAPEPPRPQFDAVVYAMRAKIASMTEITKEEADELTRPPEPPRDERQEILDRIAEIEDEMEYLQDAVDLEIATPEEEEQLLVLKKERIELKRRLKELDGAQPSRGTFKDLLINQRNWVLAKKRDPSIELIVENASMPIELLSADASLPIFNEKPKGKK